MQLICFRQYMWKKGESIDQVTPSTVWFCPQIKVIQSVAVIEEERNQINSLSLSFFFYALFPPSFSFLSLDFYIFLFHFFPVCPFSDDPGLHPPAETRAECVHYCLYTTCV